MVLNIKKAVKESTNWGELESRLNLKGGGDRTYLKNIIKENNIDISHFVKSKKTNFRLSNQEIFIDNSQVSRNVVRRRVIKENLIPYICQECGQDENWRGKKMPLILDHINGKNQDNRLKNLRFLCSNCDSIQDTYKSKNKNKKSNVNLKRIEKNSLKELIVSEIKSSNINFNERGWRKKLSIKYNWSPQYSGTFIKKNIPELWGKAKKNIK